MSFLRWAATIVGFPLGGLAAITVASTASGPLSAAVAGLIAGAILGLGQWLALRPHVSPWWIVASALGLAGGGAVATAVTAGASDLGSLALFGAISGAAVGIAQGIVLGARRLAVWLATVSLSWAAAWVITSLVIVDEQRGYIVFGLSGAALATLATGIVLRLLLGARPERARTAEVTA